MLIRSVHVVDALVRHRNRDGDRVGAALVLARSGGGNERRLVADHGDGGTLLLEINRLVDAGGGSSGSGLRDRGSRLRRRSAPVSSAAATSTSPTASLGGSLVGTVELLNSNLHPLEDHEGEAVHEEHATDEHRDSKAEADGSALEESDSFHVLTLELVLHVGIHAVLIFLLVLGVNGAVEATLHLVEVVTEVVLGLSLVLASEDVMRERGGLLGGLAAAENLRVSDGAPGAVLVGIALASLVDGVALGRFLGHGVDKVMSKLVDVIITLEASTMLTVVALTLATLLVVLLS